MVALVTAICRGATVSSSFGTPVLDDELKRLLPMRVFLPEEPFDLSISEMRDSIASRIGFSNTLRVRQTSQTRRILFWMSGGHDRYAVWTASGMSGENASGNSARLRARAFWTMSLTK